MDFAHAPRVIELRNELEDFMQGHVYPAERVFAAQVAASRWEQPRIIEELKEEARRRGLWNLFLPNKQWGAGLTNLEYAPLAEVMGRSIHLAPEATNCSAPDTGNMEVLSEFANADQQDEWLRPLLDGSIRSAYAMTEPDVASSDAANISISIVRERDEYVINGRKWWTSGACHPHCRLLILMGKTDPSAAPYRQQSMVIVPMDTPGVTVERHLPIFGYDDAPHGHAEISFADVRVPVTNVIKGEGDGFVIAQGRLGPGRIHHCMRLIGIAERALEALCSRVQRRVAFGKHLAEQGVIQDWIAESRIEIEQARLLVLKTAWLMDTVGNKGARTEIAAIKVLAPRMTCNVIDRAIQAHGGAGVSDDFPLAYLWAYSRMLRIADGPDEVHKRTVARHELGRYEHLRGTSENLRVK